MVEHVEKYVAPTITSDQILGGKPFRLQGRHPPDVAMVIADDEYRTEATLPAFASAHLIKDYRVDYILDQEGARDDLAGIDVLAEADLMVVSARRRVLPEGQVDALREFVADGKPVVGIRTASHAFAPRAGAKVPAGRDAWPGFDAEVLGGHYTNHHGAGPIGGRGPRRRRGARTRSSTGSSPPAWSATARSTRSARWRSRPRPS